jgi:hypothetical protein
MGLWTAPSFGDNIMKTKNEPRCCSCGRTFKFYGMDVSEAYKLNGLLYCNQDCQMEGEVAKQEAEEWQALSDQYWERS